MSVFSISYSGLVDAVTCTVAVAQTESSFRIPSEGIPPVPNEHCIGATDFE